MGIVGDVIHTAQKISAMSETPAKLYKYRSLAGIGATWVEDIVVRNTVYFASAMSFNDPFDLKPSFSLRAPADCQREDYLRMSRKFEPYLTEAQRLAEVERVMATAMSAENIEETVATIQFVHNQFLTTSVGVFCVSTKRDDILMWSHYADSHRGVCLEFDGLAPLMAHAQAVEYSEDRVPINAYEDNDDVAMRKALLTKSTHWAYEAEWRLISYAKGPGLTKFRPNNLTGIIVGASASPSTLEMVRNWIRQRSAPIKLYCASTNAKKFEIDIREIEK